MGDTVQEPITGDCFPAQQQFWHGGLLDCIGAGARVKKVALVSVKVYAVAMYVDAGAAGQAAQQEQAARSEAAAMHVLRSGAFTKVLQMRLVRGVSGKQFTGALDESLRPLLSGDEAVLDGFCAFFADRQLEQGAEVTLLWRSDGPTEVALRQPGDATPYAQVAPGLAVASPRLGQAMWKLYLSPSTPSPAARSAWLSGVAALAGRGAGG